jgi:iron complex transport system substrate-binding protein
MARPVRARIVALCFALGFALASVLALAGCAGTTEVAQDDGAQPPADAAAFPVTVTDDADREVTIEAQPERVVSLAPANTEIVAALGIEERLVGVTTYDDYPPSVADIPKVGDFVTPNMEAIAAADPDLVLATSGVQADVVEQLEGTGAAVLVIDPQTLDGVYAAIEIVGAATGESGAAQDLVDEMKDTASEVEQAVAGEPVPRVFIEIGQNPLFTAGADTLIGDLVVRAGGENVVAESGYVAYSSEQLISADPEVYLATLGSMSDPEDVETRAGYDGISAVKAGRVFVLDDNLVTRPGPRAVEGLEQIAQAIHPAAFEE